MIKWSLFYLKIKEAYVILPIRRRGTIMDKLDVKPCGGAPKRLSDTLTNKGSLINVIWETRTPYRNGNCTIGMNPGK